MLALLRLRNVRSGDPIADIEAVNEDAVPAIEEAQGNHFIAKNMDLFVPHVRSDEAEQSVHFRGRPLDHLEEVPAGKCEHTGQIVTSMEHFGQPEDMLEICRRDCWQHATGVGEAAQEHVLNSCR